MLKQYKFIIFLLMLYGCGYRPFSAYSTSLFGEKIYIDIQVNYRDPENSVLVKDALLDAVAERLNAVVATSADEADSFIKVSIQSVRFASLAENREGFTNFYRVYVVLFFEYQDLHGKTDSMTTTGRYTFSIDISSILTDSRRLDAIRRASEQALDIFIAKIATI